MDPNNQEFDENDDFSDDVYISENDDGINYVQDGEDFDIGEAKQSDNENEDKGEAPVEAMNENDLAAEINQA